ncbi:MAG: hypothetical protein H7259_04865, partial [Cytophagales bacterium]|nr:hypothetical protein [Cytophaga sp.]
MIKNTIIPVLFLAILNGCTSHKDWYKVSGQIIFEDVFHCQVFTSEEQISTFKVRPKKIDYNAPGVIHKLSNCSWFGKDYLIGVELSKTGDEGTIFSNLVVMDLQGNVVERLTSSEKYHYVGYRGVSNSRSKILYSSWYTPPIMSSQPTPKELAQRLSPITSIHIMNYNTKEIELSIENFAKEKGGYQTTDESPWSPDETRIVYTIHKKPSVSISGKSLYGNDSVVKSTRGSYIFDIAKKQDVAFIPESTQAIWSPVSDTIAYLKNKEVWLYDVLTDTHIPFIKATEDLKVYYIHWEPSGKYLYVSCGYKGRSSERLYSVKDGME